jgi:hypothetical protein
MDKDKQKRVLYEPILKKGTHLAPSKEIEGAVLGSELDDKTNKLQGQAKWREVEVSEFDYDDPYVYQETQPEYELTPEEQAIAKMLGEAVAAGTIWVLDEVVIPKVKSVWQKRVLPSIKEQWHKFKVVKNSNKIKRHWFGKNAEVVKNSEIVSGLVTHDLDQAYEKYVHDMTSEEAQRELLDIFILSILLTAKIRKLSTARIVKNSSIPSEYIYGQVIIQKLTSTGYLGSINQILENNPMLLEEKSAILSELFGYSIVLNRQYIPIEVDQFKDVLYSTLN